MYSTNAKVAVWAIILLIYDTSFLVGLTSIGEMTYLWIVLPIALVLNLWGLRLLFKNAYSTQMEMVLFFGVLGLIGSITSFLLIIGLSMHTLLITRSEEHTSELQSRGHLVCRLLLDKKNK